MAYLHDVAVSESLPHGISAVEIALRHSIHNAFTTHTGTDQWFWAMLKQSDLNVINDKWARLAARLKAPRHRVSHRAVNVPLLALSVRAALSSGYLVGKLRGVVQGSIPLLANQCAAFS